ncbi:MAG: hypothetical protein Q8942_20460, partial [Bacillota bacterium]|nr:hypothetical protein [Bacillota bacterium]
EKDVNILRQKRILTAKTNARGEFRFFVNEGDYALSIDIDTIPVGKGVVEANRFLKAGERNIIDFTVKDIDSIDIENGFLKISDGEHFSINPIFKDKDGNILSAKANILPENKDIEIGSQTLRVLSEFSDEFETNIIIDAGKIIRRAPIHISKTNICSLAKINKSHRLGIIDDNTRIQYLLQALINKRELPKDYYSTAPIKSGTGIIDEITRFMHRSDAQPEILEKARKYVDSSLPELDRTYMSPSGYFKIHYTLNGENAVASNMRNSRIAPPYIKQIGVEFDRVKDVTCAKRGFREPILEKEKNTYDIYVYNLKGIYGVTYSKPVSNDQNERSRVASSYICIDNNYSNKKGFDKSREECMKVTAAHEFFHAVQHAYCFDADIWWKEASATWNEDEVYTGVNDYIRYIKSYFSEPYISLDETSYSGVVFAKFLSENYGGYDTIKKIWEMQASRYETSIDAIDAVIRENYAGEDIGKVFNRFSAYNVNPAQYYKEGDLWKEAAAAQNIHSSYPMFYAQGQLNHLSSNYQLFKPIAYEEGKSLKIIIDGEFGAKWGFKLQKRNKKDKLYSITEIMPKGKFNRVEIMLKDFGDVYDEVYFIPSNLEKESNRIKYAYSASIVQV